MTATRPTTGRYSPNQPNNNNNSGSLAKRTRGPINKRACQRCRQGKIKCDGDAESGKPCSNCDPQHCKYDNSPRKNKQVESLKLRLTAVEDQLLAITTDYSEQLSAKDMEKEIICLLYESKEQFMPHYDPLFKRLLDALKQSRCVRNILPIIFELLKRIGEGKNVDYVPDLMKSLQRLVDFSDSLLGKDAAILAAFNIDLAQPYPTDPMLSMQPTLPLQNDMNQLNLQAGDSDDSETNSYEIDDANGEPSTPENHHLHNQQQQTAHTESKCYNSNNVQHHVPSQSPIPITTTSSAQDFGTSFFGYHPQPYFPGTDFNNVMENSNYGINFLATSSTSPTEEPWGVNMNH